MELFSHFSFFIIFFTFHQKYWLATFICVKFSISTLHISIPSPQGLHLALKILKQHQKHLKVLPNTWPFLDYFYLHIEIYIFTIHVFRQALILCPFLPCPTSSSPGGWNRVLPFLSSSCPMLTPGGKGDNSPQKYINCAPGEVCASDRSSPWRV